ncbi:MAG: ribonuclease III [Candidatus Moranbacteria bacterium]|nr:ribonuclease III [Candidatus Moranbacteria bacterium]
MVPSHKTLLEKSARDLAKSLKIKFKNLALLENSLIHRSFINEHRNWRLESNERLEFLGDAVLELIVTDYLFHHYPNEEGELTNWRAALVSAESLAPVAEKLNIEKYLFVGRGEQKNRRSKLNILADGIEAVIGAIYLDQGKPQATKFIQKNILVKLPTILENQLFVDAKTALQELAQKQWKITPEYKVLKEGGPDHNKWFEVGVYINEKLSGKGKGSSKQKAEKEAAQTALEKLNK